MLASEEQVINDDYVYKQDFNEDLVWRSLQMVRQTQVYKRKIDRVKMVMKPYQMNKCSNPTFVQSRQNNRIVYMLGGLENSMQEEGCKMVFEINHETGIMRKKPCMNIGRFAFAAACVRHYIVVVGGLERTLLNISGSDVPNGIKECSIFNTFTDKWYKLPPLPGDRI